jgi:hypothetical protein
MKGGNNMMTGFGYPPPEGYTGPYWGCRAIYNPPKLVPQKRFVTRRGKALTITENVREDCYVDIVNDRTSSQAMSEDLSNWLPDAFKQMRKWLNDGFIQTNSREVFTLTFPAPNGKVYTLQASCNGSYGYLYIGAWEKETNYASKNP